jgi:hypothetical protein
MFMISIMEPEAVPENIIMPTNVFADFKETYPNTTAIGIVMQGDVLVRHLYATFRLDAKNASPTVVKIPDVQVF